jgi:ferritin-like metal-binding protein YciE
MGLLYDTFDTLDDLFLQQLEDVYDAEKRLVDALPKMADAAKHHDLKAAFQNHLRETEVHVRRLEEVFRELGKEPQREACDAMKGLISEGNSMVNAGGDDDVRDAGLIAAAQRVEHYEMASYGTLRTLAKQLGHQGVATTLQQTLDEEGAADRKLTELAETHINAEARH